MSRVWPQGYLWENLGPLCAEVRYEERGEMYNSQQDHHAQLSAWQAGEGHRRKRVVLRYLEERNPGLPARKKYLARTVEMGSVNVKTDDRALCTQGNDAPGV